jgi:hypothetical protein
VVVVAEDGDDGGVVAGDDLGEGVEEHLAVAHEVAGDAHEVGLLLVDQATAACCTDIGVMRPTWMSVTWATRSGLVSSSAWRTGPEKRRSSMREPPSIHARGFHMRERRILAASPASASLGLGARGGRGIVAAV